MTKKQNNILIVLFILISFFIGLSFYFIFFKVENKVTRENNKSEISEISEENKVTFTVIDKVYKVSKEEGATVYDVMNTLQNNKENNFSFKAKDYADMGYFIEEINGIKGETGKYWIYSVNGKEASISVSKYILKNGDNILWEQKAF